MGETMVHLMGATGFVGAAVVSALAARGADVVDIRLPRVVCDPTLDVREQVTSHPAFTILLEQLTPGALLVNCAGNPDASNNDANKLRGANSLVPAIAAAAARERELRRFVHVSSAVVQGAAETLDSSPPPPRGFSPYADSKAQGEHLATEFAPTLTTCYRPPSVHAPDRRVTRQISALARRRLGFVAAPGSAPTPQALLPNVADAIAFLALCEEQPPQVVHHPWEGVTTGTLISALGGRDPVIVPQRGAQAFLGLGRTVAQAIPRIAPYVRRAEIVMMGQRQAISWLTQHGWSPPIGAHGWTDLGAAIHHPGH